MSRRYTGNETVLLSYKEWNLNVHIEYEVEIESSYGADADGNRGMYREETFITDKYIKPPFSDTLTKEDTDEILSMAEEKFFSHC